MNILFIPGNSQSTDTFCEQLKSPLFKDHQLSVFDLEDAVASLVDPKPETFFFDLKDKLVELHKKQVFDCIIGHSWGGHLLVESISEMEGVKGIMTFGTPYIGIPPRMEDLYLPNPALPFFFTKDLTNTETSLLADACLYNKKWISFIAKGMSKSSGVLRELTPAAIATGHYTDEVEAVANLTIPLAIVQGEQETIVNPEYFKSIKMPTLWQDKVLNIPEAAHFPQLENPEVFNTILKEFLEDIG